MARFNKNVLWTQKPPTGYVMRQGLYVPDLYAVPFNEPGNTGIVRNYASRNSAGTVSQNQVPPDNATYDVSKSAVAYGKFGQRLANTTAVAKFIDWGPDEYIPIDGITVIMGYQKRDATLRASTAFDGPTSAASSNRMGALVPFSDGTVYWDFGNSAGVGRLTKSGLTFGDDIWAFTAGPRGQEIWQNGKIQASNSNTVARVLPNNFTFVLGGGEGANSDLVNWDFFYMWSYQVPQAVIQQIYERPFRIFDGSYKTTLWAGFSASALTIPIPAASLTLNTFAPELSKSIPVPVRSLAITTYAPIIGSVIEVPSASLVINGFAPSTAISIPVPAATLAFTTYAPALSQEDIDVPTASLSLSTFAPAVGGSFFIEVPSGTLTLTTYAPTVFQGNIGPCDDRFGPKIYFWEPSYLIRPEDTFLRATDWDNAGYQGLKFVQGLLIEADTEGETREILLQGDQADIETLTINHNGQITKPYSLNQPVQKHLLRLLPTDLTAHWRLFNVKWVYEPAPEFAKEWKTQGTDHDMPGFQFLKDGYIAHNSTADITLNILVDDQLFTYTIPNSGGVFEKTYILFSILNSGRALKGSLFTYELTSAEPFQLFEKDSEVRVHAWAGGGYMVKLPFGDISRVAGARI